LWYTADTVARYIAAVLAGACGEEFAGDPNDYQIGAGLFRFLGDVYHDADRVLLALPGREDRSE
jgi:hypothetical protein